MRSIPPQNHDFSLNLLLCSLPSPTPILDPTLLVLVFLASPLYIHPSLTSYILLYQLVAVGLFCFG